VDVFFRYGRWVTEGVIAEVLGQDAFGLSDFFVCSLPDAELLQLDVADSSLTATILELVRGYKSKFLPDHAVADCVLGVCSEKGVLLFFHLLPDRLVDQMQRDGLRHHFFELWEEGLLHRSLCSFALLRFRHDSLLQLLVEAFDLVRELGERRGRSLAFGERR